MIHTTLKRSTRVTSYVLRFLPHLNVNFHLHLHSDFFVVATSLEGVRSKGLQGLCLARRLDQRRRRRTRRRRCVLGGGGGLYRRSQQQAASARQRGQVSERVRWGREDDRLAKFWLLAVKQMRLSHQTDFLCRVAT